MQKIILKQSDKKLLSQYSENQKPNEACAILFGKNNEVLDIFLTENISVKYDGCMLYNSSKEIIKQER